MHKKHRDLDRPTHSKEFPSMLSHEASKALKKFMKSLAEYYDDHGVKYQISIKHGVSVLSECGNHVEDAWSLLPHLDGLHYKGLKCGCGRQAIYGVWPDGTTSERCECGEHPHL